jgi:hypothetical protein
MACGPNLTSETLFTVPQADRKTEESCIFILLYLILWNSCTQISYYYMLVTRHRVWIDNWIYLMLIAHSYKYLHTLRHHNTHYVFRSGCLVVASNTGDCSSSMLKSLLDGDRITANYLRLASYTVAGPHQHSHSWLQISLRLLIKMFENCASSSMRERVGLCVEGICLLHHSY